MRMGLPGPEALLVLPAPSVGDRAGTRASSHTAPARGGDQAMDPPLNLIADGADLVPGPPSDPAAASRRAGRRERPGTHHGSPSVTSMRAPLARSAVSSASTSPALAHSGGR